MTDVIMIVSREAKDMLVRVGEACNGQTCVSVPGSAYKILAICWILEALLAAKAAEEVVQSFVHLHALPKILAIDSPAIRSNESQSSYNERTRVQRGARNAAVELANLVLVMYEEVAAGNLLLKTPERVVLLENWHSLLGKLLTKNSSFDQATKDLYSTLPLKQQMELVKSRKDFISTDSDRDLTRISSAPTLLRSS